MHHRAAAVLGPRGEPFGNSFPIRFDFLDTVDGGNLSLQCHPRPEYIRRHFGESFTQDETYYIVDCSPGAEVYLGFRDDVQPSDFRGELERSLAESAPVDVKRHVSTTPARRHDLFLIPSGTVHCSGAGNLVLEISATPYIFTFKMYDWLRLGLDGKPRPLNIARAFENLQFDRRGDYVAEKLVSHQRTVAEGPDWRLVHAPTHAEHFYDVHRYEFDSTVSVETQGSVHVAMLVEGTEVRVEPENGPVQTFHFVETFVVSASAGRYKLVNTSGRTAKVVVAFLKPHLEQGS
jgi:mannose-6-phosphate isomerase class I